MSQPRRATTPAHVLAVKKLGSAVHPPDEVVEGYELVLRAEAAFPGHLAGS